jgi:hypothetical protein
MACRSSSGVLAQTQVAGENSDDFVEAVQAVYISREEMINPLGAAECRMALQI